MATIEIDGKTIEVENGKMIIEVADEVGIYIPRFCYHKKLSVAANCRMCLVEVENNRKTVPACATPISHGMKILTKSPAAVRSQQAVMEFLLINHPLDCPICDQGGECELQDLSMGFGRDASAYEETKRSVADDDLGPLIATEMTRCIQCTRCVRFGEEVAGLPELGGMGRGEQMQISTYVKHSMQSEVSGNIIDLCPVGALTSKPYRFTARAWEMTQSSSVAPHDCLGSHVYIHSRRNKVMRVVPKEHEPINESWLSDRDRFSYLGLNSPERAINPMIKRNGQWEEVDWKTAISFAADGIGRIIKQHGPDQFAAFASPSSSLEELYLLQKLMRSLQVNNLDYRLQQTDFRDQDLLPVLPGNTLPYAELENQNTILLIGCDVDREIPLAGVRIRKAWVNGGQVYAVNPVDYDFHFKTAETITVSPEEFPLQLATLLVALVKDTKKLPGDAQKLVIGLKPDRQTKAIAAGLQQTGAVIVTGAIVENHPEAALIRTLIGLIVEASQAKRICMTVGANSAGASVAGMLPHRGAAGKIPESAGLDVQAALNAKLKGYFLMAVEPGFDFANPHGARQSMLRAEFVVVLSAFQNEAIQDYANVILPMAPYAETSGTYINLDGCWQTVKGAVAPQGESRPAWKILRVLGNLLHSDGFDYASTQDILDELQGSVTMMAEIKPSYFYPESLPSSTAELIRIGEWPLYRSDAIVRQAHALQTCGSAETACIRMHSTTADKLNLGATATVSQTEIEITLPLVRDDRIALDAVWVANAMPETVDLGHAYAAITIK